MYGWFEERFKLSSYEKAKKNWEDKIFYQTTISFDEQYRIEKILIGTTFLKEAFQLIFDAKFELKDIRQNGIFIAKISSSFKRYLYRISINTISRKHYDLMIFIKPDIKKQRVLDTIYLMIKIGNASSGLSSIPRLGNFRSELGVISFAYINDLNLWEKIRQLTSTYSSNKIEDYKTEWEILYRRGMATFFLFLKNSEFKVIPGNISPNNVVVPEPFFKHGNKIISITGWENYKSHAQLIVPLYENFYLQMFAQYPWSREILKYKWIFDACLEGLGQQQGIKFLTELNNHFNKKLIDSVHVDLKTSLDKYLERRKTIPNTDSFLLSSFKNYKDWQEENPASTKKAKADFIKNLFSLYHLERYPEISRFIFIERTYFYQAENAVKDLFRQIIDSLYKFPNQPVTKRIELVELQNLLVDKYDRDILNKAVFPKLKDAGALELAHGGDLEKSDLIIVTEANDIFGNVYEVRKPVSPFEIGSLQKLFIVDNYPLKITPDLHYLILVDAEENLIGGIRFKIMFPKIAQIEGIEISKSFRRRGLGGKLIEEFFQRITMDGIKTVTTHFILKKFFEKHNFKTDSRWGGLVKLLK